MKYVVMYIGIFSLIFIIDYLFTYFFFVKKNKLAEQKSYYFIVRKYQLKMDNKKKTLLGKLIVLVNSFTLSIPLFYVIAFDNMEYWLELVLCGLFCVFMLVFLYCLVGRILKKKGW